MALEVTGANYAELVEQATQPVLLDFWAEWCGPCRMLGPVIDEIASEYNGRAIVAKVNIDKSEDLAKQFGIRNVPTLIFIKGGEIKSKLLGALPKKKITEVLDTLL